MMSFSGALPSFSKAMVRTQPPPGNADDAESADCCTQKRKIGRVSNSRRGVVQGDWNVQEVQEFLGRCNNKLGAKTGEYQRIVAENDIDGEVLKDLGYVRVHIWYMRVRSPLHGSKKVLNC